MRCKRPKVTLTQHINGGKVDTKQVMSDNSEKTFFKIVQFDAFDKLQQRIMFDGMTVEASAANYIT